MTAKEYILEYMKKPEYLEFQKLELARMQQAQNDYFDERDRVHAIAGSEVVDPYELKWGE